MRIARARITPFALPLRAPLRTALGDVAVRRGVLVCLESADGFVGWGEGTAPDGFGAESLEECLAASTRYCGALLDREPRKLEALFAQLDAHSARAPTARFAVETALLDLGAQARGAPLADVLGEGRAARRSVPVNALLRETEPSAAADEAKRAVARGFATLKLKVGADTPSADCARVFAVREAVRREAELRIDANGAWSPELAIAILRELDAVDLELAEQPVAADDIAGLARVRAAVLVPIAADESVTDFARAARLLEARAADALVLKPAALGGLRPAAVLAQRARALGVRVLVTSSIDGAIARAAALALAASLPDPLHACGLATGELLAGDLCPGLEPKDGYIDLAEIPGLGVAPQEAALAEFALGPAREVTAL